MKPNETEYPEYYRPYVDVLGSADLAEVYRQQHQAIKALSVALNEEQSRYRYAPGKWSVNEVLGHLIDCERVFAYRAMCIARGEVQPLPGFDENAYVATASFDQRPLAKLVEEFVSVRIATLMLLESMTTSELLRAGTANGNPITVRAIMWIIAGHTQHHWQILEVRYGVRFEV